MHGFIAPRCFLNKSVFVQNINETIIMSDQNGAAEPPFSYFHETESIIGLPTAQNFIVSHKRSRLRTIFDQTYTSRPNPSHSKDSYYLPTDEDPLIGDFYSKLGASGPGSRLSRVSTSDANAEFDRYPCRVSSMTTMTSSSNEYSPTPGGERTACNSSIYSGSSPNFKILWTSPNKMANQEASPFGGHPPSSFPLFEDEKEYDDLAHDPIETKARFNGLFQDGLDRRGAVAVLTCGCMILGAIMVFIILPVLTFSGVAIVNAPKPQKIELLSDYEYGILGAIRTRMVDPDTPKEAMYHTAKDGSKWNLVFSDEFDKEGRTFYEGDDQFWTAVDMWYSGTQDLEWYDPDAITTNRGTLTIQMDAWKNHDLFYRSGMLQSWNKLCFTEGYMEVSANLGGHGDVPGIWPAVWAMGNLARPGYRASTDGVWPYSYNECDAGITPNQSSSDGMSYLPGQRLSSCTCPGHDHPNEGVGRGAPEIDLLEGTFKQYDKSRPVNGIASQSFQTAPFDVWYLPDYDFLEIRNKSITAMNTFVGSTVQETVSAYTQLNWNWYEMAPAHNYDPLTPFKPQYQKYGFEYLNDDTTGYIRWFVGDEPTMTMYAPSLGPNGNIGQRLLPKEPMSMVMNLAIATSWIADIDWPSIDWPNQLKIDYIRVYQPPNSTKLTCDPDDYPTYKYIKDHENAYQNSNLTSFKEAGYEFPPNRLMHKC